LFVCVTTLVAAGVIYGDAVTLGGLRTALRAAGPADTSILVRTPAPPRDVVTLDASVRPVLTEVLGPGGGEVDQVARSDSMEIAALWRPNRADPYWLANPLELDGVETHGSETVRGPLVVAPADLAASTIRQLDVQWRARPDVEAFRVEWIDGVRTGITALRDR